MRQYGEPIRLGVEERVETIEARGIAGRAVPRRDRGSNVRRDRLGSIEQRREPLAGHILLATSLVLRLDAGRRPWRQVLQRGQDAQQLAQVGVVFAEALAQRIEVVAQDHRRFAGIDGEGVPAVANRERAGIGVQREVAALEHAAVLIVEDRQQHLVLELALHRRPVDVEVARQSDAGPFCRTSHHQRLRSVSMPM